MSLAIMKRVACLILLATLLGACASQVPKAIREPVPGDGLALGQVRADNASHRDARVRWGGTVASVDNRKSETCVEIVERGLDSEGRPQTTDSSGGRFLACTQGFLDPDIYTQGRQVTIAGTLNGQTTRTIGEFPYRLPVVMADSVYLWEPRSSYYPYSYYPYYYPFYDPFFYGPFFPFGGVVVVRPPRNTPGNNPMGPTLRPPVRPPSGSIIAPPALPSRPIAGPPVRFPSGPIIGPPAQQPAPTRPVIGPHRR